MQFNTKRSYIKERKRELFRQRLIYCSLCRFHGGENRNRRIPKDDRYKNHRRF